MAKITLEGKGRKLLKGVKAQDKGSKPKAEGKKGHTCSRLKEKAKTEGKGRNTMVEDKDRKQRQYQNIKLYRM